jgi:DNA-binding CsgD family transcriptional regulator
MITPTGRAGVIEQLPPDLINECDTSTRIGNGGAPPTPTARPGLGNVKGREALSEVAHQDNVAVALPGPVRVDKKTPMGISLPQTAPKSQAGDRLLLGAFLSVRSRTRGPLVAINQRTMITNLGASELLQPADRRLLWEHVKTASSEAGATTTLVLRSGVEVRILAQLVSGELSSNGAVLHLSVKLPARQTRPVAPAVEVGAGGPPGNRAPDPSLMTGWTDLTDTERTVAELVARGMTNKQTGRLMFLSRHTVDYHLRRVFKKLGVSSRVELARALGEHYEALNGC